MKSIHTMPFLAITLLSFASAWSASPPMPSMTNGDGNSTHNGMKHLAVHLHGTEFEIHAATSPPSPLTMMSAGNTDFTPSKFDVLEGKYFNAQPGWIPDGLFTGLPTDAAVWIERVSASQPAGSQFRVYEGGNMSEGMGAWTMNEVYLADGARWRWDGAMQHDYYTADIPGQYSMNFRVYAGDAAGNPVPGFSAGTATISFVAVPEPYSLGAHSVALMCLCALRQRRRI